MQVAEGVARRKFCARLAVAMVGATSLLAWTSDAMGKLKYRVSGSVCALRNDWDLEVTHVLSNTWIAHLKPDGGTGQEDTYPTLYAHDYDSDAFCSCDDDTRTGGAGAFGISLQLAGDANSNGCVSPNCQGGAAPMGWALNVEIMRQDSSPNYDVTTIKLLSAYDFN